MAQELFRISDGLAVNVNPSGKFHGWLFTQHPDGQWVSVRKLETIDPFVGAKGYAIVPCEANDEMLNAAQSKLCEMENFTNFNDRHQAEMFKAMVAAACEPKRYLTEG